MSNRKPKLETPPPIKEKADTPLITETRSYKLITPLYGGGVEPEKADPITMVRATEIRGHLRFWWRATRGGAFGDDLDAMRRAEEKIWGSAAGKYKDGTEKPGPSKVAVVVNVKNRGEEEIAFEVKAKEKVKDGKTVIQPDTQASSKIAEYAAFPLMPKAKGKNNVDETKQIGWQSNPVQLNVEFEVGLKYPEDCAEDVEAALWAWETFGGIGARTRRGFGALQLYEKDEQAVHPISASELKTEIENRLVKIAGAWPSGIPHLRAQMHWEIVDPFKGNTTANEVWKHLITQLKKFRQTRHWSTNYDNPYGRSKWPEPEAIRKITGDRLPKHAPLPNPIDKFPRGQFGLPIIFKFKDDDKGEPQQTSLQGKDHDRLASPLILRPLACAGGAVGLAAVLEWEPLASDEPYTPPGGLRLIGDGLNKPVESKLDASEAAQIPILENEPDVLKAFLEYLKGK